ncbi:hypothetical protein ACIBBD_25815 [Streptomyces sp. NPDC051315]|uniref:hypothetical protein n=1 Tax=Streptomyces sp. NPDC051315 TaxID=3365650 RepID=UPI0037937D63
MAEHLSIPRLAGATVLALACAASLVGVVQVRRRSRRGAGAQGFRAGCASRGSRSGSFRAPRGALPAVPRQRRAGPHPEDVRLTPAEQAAFACLVRRLAGGR